MDETTQLFFALAIAFFSVGIFSVYRSLDRKRLMLEQRAEFADFLAMEIRDTWDHLPRFIQLRPGWNEIAHEIGLGLPRLLLTVTEAGLDPRRAPIAAEMFIQSGVNFQRIDQEVAKLNDPTLTALWESRRLHDLVAALRLALFKTWQPGFDLSPLYREPALGGDK